MAMICRTLILLSVYNTSQIKKCQGILKSLKDILLPQNVYYDTRSFNKLLALFCSSKMNETIIPKDYEIYDLIQVSCVSKNTKMHFSNFLV